MKVAGGEFRRDRQDRAQMRDRLVAEADRLAVVEVADVLRDERLAAARQRHRVLEIGAGGQDARAVGAEVDRIGDEAARAAQMKRARRR